MRKKVSRLANLLLQKYPIYSIAFIGIKGESRRNFSDEENIAFNTIKEVSKRDLIRIIGEKASSNHSFLPLSDDIFLQNMDVTYTQGGTKKLAPARQFDAIITYPEISILKSMETYSY